MLPIVLTLFIDHNTPSPSEGTRRHYTRSEHSLRLSTRAQPPRQLSHTLSPGQTPTREKVKRRSAYGPEATPGAHCSTSGNPPNPAARGQPLPGAWYSPPLTSVSSESASRGTSVSSESASRGTSVSSESASRGTSVSSESVASVSTLSHQNCSCIRPSASTILRLSRRSPCHEVRQSVVSLLPQPPIALPWVTPSSDEAPQEHLSSI